MATTGSPYFGAGSQPPEQDGAELDFVRMPPAMMTCRMPDIPEPSEVAGTKGAMQALTELGSALGAYEAGQAPRTFDLAGLDRDNLALVDQVLGEGEVSDYRILAPTEWNFHPRGVVARALADLDGNDDDSLRG